MKRIPIVNAIFKIHSQLKARQRIDDEEIEFGEKTEVSYVQILHCHKPEIQCSVDTNHRRNYPIGFTKLRSAVTYRNGYGFHNIILEYS
jgi:hypothetical protein